MKKKVLVILGPTASGKSALAVKLAKKFNGEIISADSRQVYRGLDIGTGKITKREMRGVPHHLLDLADPRKQFNVAQYKKLAEEKIKEINFPIVVGGTGFYIDALAGLTNFPDVPPNKKFREKLNRKSATELFKILQRKDLKRAWSIDPNNKVRLVRALEIIEVLGHVPRCQPATSTPYRFIYIGLRPDNLNKKILLRIRKWLKNGLVDEVRKLHTDGISWKRFDEIGLIYHTVTKYLQGKISKEQMVQEMFIEIRQYAKRQMTWFKRNKKIKWFKPEDLNEIEKHARMTLLGL
ncbi:MAG: tRNA (adenosine(37)-N6)-dimethylallyltransferase MiaA [Candidatus Zambryskibacteria bacterium RIFCSPHIGHO2_02_FULL_43_14]|uniref:tRNA dimethylallyltransferase n=1 Tax=Candidatus Zambryskibacteria bacterium RIFCSPHIGHO2_02_FULL_43_14 TaxID=1802748 RepID=A0A1G2TIE7_9BACT|nr:MAG: tRNA (adenosine(37)-N6)-dimethylallyltransferase MiaA [Candidatus Zambryskibacteria bacterium RIFCSPHIGHO2_01_FULL_43_60]OHA97084.1 MAG: tRNA (adenosine(37)-N6)-dimethylallyltransferase MiaA [Candidatus Zambryskibacteria bacterium RIFCSPHIGHO2_02_FULL_43_14]